MPQEWVDRHNVTVDEALRRPLRIVDHDEGWTSAFTTIGAAIRDRLDQAALRIDHIVIDIQVTVADLDVGRRWPHEMLPGLVRRQR